MIARLDKLIGLAAPPGGAGRLRGAVRRARGMTGPQPRPEILTIQPYVGGESDLPGVNRTIKLSSNEGAFGVPPGAQAAIKAVTEEVFRYPDGGADALREALGKRWGLDPARIVCGAGVGRPDLPALPVLWRAGARHHHVGARVLDLPHRRHLCRQPGDQGRRTQPDRRPGRHAGRGVAGHAADVPGQSEQPYRLHGAGRRGRPAARAAAA